MLEAILVGLIVLADGAAVYRVTRMGASVLCLCDTNGGTMP